MDYRSKKTLTTKLLEGNIGETFATKKINKYFL